MRLINGDLINNLPEDVPDQYKGKEADAYLDGIGYVLKSLDNLPDIDTETLPIVRELRANIAILEQIIENGSNPIDKDKIVLLMMENAALKSQIVNITAEKNAEVR